MAPGIEATLSRAGVQGVFAARGLEVVAGRLDVDAPAVTAFARWLCEAERHRAARLRFERDRRRFIVARGLLRALLAARIGGAPQEIAFTYGHHGKPALAPQFAHTGWRFNLAHCDDVAVYAFSRDAEVGIDIEAVHAFDEADDIASRFFSARENCAYLALRPSDRPLGFFNCWTRKEAFVKALGDGLHVALDRFDVSLAPQAPAAILRIDAALGSPDGWQLDSFSPRPGFVAAVASRLQ